MRKGFTMIELIFVIVILGILAAVAIPRLAATRDDAEITKTISNTTLAIRDAMSYYTAQGNFNAIAANMTNVTLVDNAGAPIAKTTATTAATTDVEAYVPFKATRPCVKLVFNPSESVITVTENTGLTGADKAACASIAKAPGVDAMIKSKYNKSDGTGQDSGVKVGGTSNIQF